MANEHECDSLGRCVHHPFVQLKRLSERTGEWKVLFETCPLCVMDTQSVSGGSSACNSLCSSDVSAGRDESEDERGDLAEPKTCKRSKVSFHQDVESAGVLQRSSSSRSSLVPLSAEGASCAGSVASNSSSSALKAPRYKVCRTLMQRQLDESKGVWRMSEDLDISDDEDSVDEPVHKNHSPRRVAPRSREHPSGRSSPCPARRIRSGRSSPCPAGRNRHQSEPQVTRPDPEEFPCNVSTRVPRRSSPQHQCFNPSMATTTTPCASNVNMVIQVPRDYKDDISAVTFGMESVSAPAQAVPVHCEAVVEDVENEEDWPINTNEYDEKGRCVRHPHVKLRKKKMFGKKWKVLMSACPDCCVDELKRIRFKKESGRKKRASAVALNSPQPLSSTLPPSPQQPTSPQQPQSAPQCPLPQSPSTPVGSSTVSSSSRSSSRSRARSPMPMLRAKSPMAVPRAKSPMTKGIHMPQGPVKVGSSSSTVDTANLTDPSSDSSIEEASFSSRVIAPLPSRGRHRQVVPNTEPQRAKYNSCAVQKVPRRDGKSCERQEQQRIPTSRGRARSESRTRREGGRSRSRSKSSTRARSESRCRVIIE